MFINNNNTIKKLYHKFKGNPNVKCDQKYIYVAGKILRHMFSTLANPL